MTAYYNEIDPYAADWLRNLIRAGHIADGVVDTRSIEDVRPSDLTEFTQCHFFAGIGGWSLALRMAGWDDSRPVWTGSCPCQPFSQAGEGRGMDDDRHLWPAWFHLIGQCRPATIFGEQVEAAIAHGWLDLVQDDLEGIGYAFAPVGLPAASVGAPHIRHRLWWVANAGHKHARGSTGPGEAESGRASSDAARCGALGASSPLAHAVQSGRAERRTGTGRGSVAGCGASGELAHAAIPRSLPGTLGRVRGSEEGAGSRDAESERPSATYSVGDPMPAGLPLRQSPELQGTRGGA